MKLIGFAGKKRSGKDTAAQTLVTSCDYTQFSFASLLKEMTTTLLIKLGLDPLTVARMVNGDLKEMPLPQLMGKTTRHAMQTLGTEWGRQCIGENFWVAATLRQAKTVQKAVISDVRFANEAQAIREAGGKVIELRRPDVRCDDSHPSEQIDFTVDDVILNVGTIEELQTAVIDYERRN